MNLLDLSVFHSVFYPPRSVEEKSEKSEFLLRRPIRFSLDAKASFRDYPLVIFDFETTGLDMNRDRIIEVGAIKYVDMEAVEEYATLVATDSPLPAVVERISGITQDMLEGKPRLPEVLPSFLKFIKGSILVAHNAPFDMAFLKKECQRQGIDLEWPTFCTLKMAREFLPQLDSKGLDSLAKHYGLHFEARHRSIGDVKVTHSVLKNFLMEEGKHLEIWEELQAFRVV